MEKEKGIKMERDKSNKTIINYIKFRMWHFAEVRKKGLEFEVELAGNCNLNCWGCNHFSPLVKDELLSVDEFERDCECLGKILHHKMKRMKLLGGEPLLNPHIEEMLYVARKNFKKGEIQIITNGVLLTKMPETFWRVCKENKIVINITKYPINLDYEHIKMLAKKYRVRLFIANEEGVKNQEKCVIDLQGKQDEQYAYDNCYIAKDCHTLKKGKMYCCSFAAHISRFSDYFGLDMEISDNNGIEIAQVKKEEELLRFLKSPIPACKYCDVDTRWKQKKYPWKVSECKMSEWVDDE